jgi:single-stranded-DNA-specific exonuclease
VPGVDVGAAIRAARAAGVLEAGGGHVMAAGFALSAHQIEPLGAFLARWFEDVGAAPAANDLTLDLVVSPGGASGLLVDELARLGPFGAGNPEPVCAVLGATLAHADVVGQKHVRLRLTGGDGARLDAIAFRAVDTPLGRALLGGRGRVIHAAGYLRQDEWNGRVRTQLVLEDAAPASV